MCSWSGAIVKCCRAGRWIGRFPDFMVTQRGFSIVFGWISIAAFVIAVVGKLK